jgi:hypothetical protein
MRDVSYTNHFLEELHDGSYTDKQVPAPQK